MSELKHTKPTSWWSALKRLPGMLPIKDSENLCSQLHIIHIDKNPLDVANKVNEAFLTSTQEYQPPITNLFSNSEANPDYEFSGITVYSSFNILRKLNPRKACGPDGIPNWLLKAYAEILAEPVSSILNSSYEEQKLPTAWKFTNIIPIPKQKPITDVNEYLRPINPTPSISKVAEEFIISKYIAPAVLKVIDLNQYGAIPKSSTVRALISMIQQWSQVTDGSGAVVRVVLFDYRKVFDLVDHQILTKKIHNLPIPRKVACWVVDFLMDRFQRVKVSNAHSQWKCVPSGVLQGTKLCPWLHLLMINDLHLEDVGTWKFVDDITASEVVPEGSTGHIRRAVSYVEKWSIENKLHLNPEKFKELDLKREKQQFDPIIVNNQPLQVVDYAKILSLAISNTLRWNHHIYEVIKKANKCPYCLVQLKRAKVPEIDIINFYCICIRPTLEYAAQVFHHSTQVPGRMNWNVSKNNHLLLCSREISERTLLHLFISMVDEHLYSIYV